MIEVRVQRVGNVRVPLPSYQTTGSAGMDLHAAVERSITIGPRERVLVPTGLRMAIPPGYEGQIRPRSGLAARKGLTVLNAPGTIDSDFRGDVSVLLVNLGVEPVMIEPGDRIAQIVFARHETASMKDVTSLDETERGTGGYGSTGGFT